jgi:peptidyl-prolyl cis-trans isomerase A (cyclophilin A)
MFRFVLLTLVLAIVPPLVAQQPEAEEEKKADPLHPRVKMVTTLGEFVLELDAEKAPVSVDNFLRYAADGYYNGTVFHRIVHKEPGRSMIDVIQGGGRTADLERKKESLRPPIKNEWQNGLKNKRGTISMARTHEPDSATSQFFISTADNETLDQPAGGAAYAVFGQVVEGMDVVDKIRNTKLLQHPRMLKRWGAVTPAEAVVIQSVTLLDGLTYAEVAAVTKPAVEAAAKELAERARAEAEAQAKAKAAAEDRAKTFKALLANGEDENGNKLQKSPTGLMYVVLKEGEGPSPTFVDEKLRETTTPTDWLLENKDAQRLPDMAVVEAHYTGWLTDGTQFDSSRNRDRPATFPLHRVIKGWFEGVSMMKVGGRRLLIVPPDMAYGSRGRPGIPPHSTLVFDVELLSIKESP